MDGVRIDALARLFAAGFPRRQVVSGLVAGIVTPLFARSGHVGAAACKKTGKPCDRNRDCCAHAHCPGNKCRCKSGFTDCDGKCFKLENDEKHCGACDTKCGATARCCAGNCADFDTDPSNCGACGNQCADDEGCFDGICLDPRTCPSGTGICQEIQPVACGVAGCVCAESVEGEMYCAKFIPGEGCGCVDSQSCFSNSGPDTICVKAETCCEPGSQSVCMRVCSESAP